MTYLSKPVNHIGDSSECAQKLMVHGFVCPESNCTLSIEVRRGMPILSKDGMDVGKVAAVILDRHTQKATHLLLGRLPEMRGYWMVPVNLISEVHNDIVQLDVPGSVVETLPLWRSGD